MTIEIVASSPRTFSDAPLGMRKRLVAMAVVISAYLALLAAMSLVRHLVGA